LDKDSVLECFAGRKDILENGVRPLSANEKLGQTASAHSEEMLSYQYYDNISIDGKSPDERIRDTGYNPLVAGERIGIIGFRNFIEAEQAVWELFRNMFRDELACGKNQDWHILNPEFSEIGISVQAGTMNFGGNKTNIYIATCDFGASDTGEYAAKRILLQTINQIRNDPAAALSFLDMEFDAAARSLGRNGWILMLGLPPVASNEEFYAYADKDIEILPEPLETEDLGVYDLTVSDAVEVLYQELDYNAQQGVKVTATAFLGNQAPKSEKAMLEILEYIVKAEIQNSDGIGTLLLLNPDYTEAGIGYELLKIRNPEEEEEYYGVLTLVLARPAVIRPQVVGSISWRYAEENPHGPQAMGQSSESGEEETLDTVNGLTVRIEAVPVAEDLQSAFNTCFTDPAGGYSLLFPELESKVAYYQLAVSGSEEGVENKILHSNSFSYYHDRNLLKNIFLIKGESLE
jgi:hypothetical protein